MKARNAAELLQEIMTTRKVVDLTAMIGPDYPCFYFRGQPYLQVVLQGEYDGPRGQYISNINIMEDHCGTHCDAPVHMIPPPGSNLPHAGPAHHITVEKIPLRKCMGPAAVIDCREYLGKEKPGFSPVITVDKLKKWEKEHGQLQKGDIALLYTSWTELHYKKFPDGLKLEKTCNSDRATEGWPAPNEEFVEYLVNRGIEHVGTDFPSLGQIQNDEGPHWIALENEMVVVEKLVNLAQLPPRGAYYMFLPLKIENGTGSPGRAIAVL